MEIAILTLLLVVVSIQNVMPGPATTSRPRSVPTVKTSLKQSNGPTKPVSAYQTTHRTTVKNQPTAAKLVSAASWPPAKVSAKTTVPVTKPGSKLLTSTTKKHQTQSQTTIQRNQPIKQSTTTKKPIAIVVNFSTTKEFPRLEPRMFAMDGDIFKPKPAEPLQFPGSNVVAIPFGAQFSPIFNFSAVSQSTSASLEEPPTGTDETTLNVDSIIMATAELGYYDAGELSSTLDGSSSSTEPSSTVTESQVTDLESTTMADELTSLATTRKRLKRRKMASTTRKLLKRKRTPATTATPEYYEEDDA